MSSQSVINVSKTEKNDFDKWLDNNYLEPYNIRFVYRYEEVLSDFGYYTVPADYNMSIEMAHIVKYICIDSYNEVAGVDFTRTYFPKEFFLIGEWEYNNAGTIILGTAEGGKKVLLSGVNYFDEYKKSIITLTQKYLKTIHHEFTHILNQTRPMPTDFQFVSGDTYIGSEWNKAPFNDENYYLGHGHITDYSQQEYKEDFADMMSMYICYPESQWNAWLEQAAKSSVDNEYGIDAKERILQKLSIVSRYMKDNYNIDIKNLRDVIQRREAEVMAGKVSLTDLTIK